MKGSNDSIAKDLECKKCYTIWCMVCCCFFLCNICCDDDGNKKETKKETKKEKDIEMIEMTGRV